MKGVQRLERVMIQKNTPTIELIEVIQEISDEFMVGFSFKIDIARDPWRNVTNVFLKKN